MTGLGRSPLKPKESSARSNYPTAGDIAAEIDTSTDDEQSTSGLTAHDAQPVVDDDYEIDVDSPRYEDPAVVTFDQPKAKVAAHSTASAAVASAYVIDEPKPAKPEREKKERPVKEPKAPREPRVKKEREPKPPREKREKKVSPPKAEKTPKPPKEVKTPKPPRIRTGDQGKGIEIAAGVIGAIGLLLSVILAVGALFIALDKGLDSSLFAHLSDLCDALVGPLKDVFHFTGVNAGKKESLVGWGLGSMGYLLVGRFLQSVLQSQVKKP